jgi:hypothetical protein
LAKSHQIAHSVGNSKPEPLHQTEQALWCALYNISMGSNPDQELRTFALTYQDLKTQWETNGIAVDYKFFDDCGQLHFPSCALLISHYLKLS